MYIPRSFIEEVQFSFQYKHTSPHTRKEVLKLWNSLSKEQQKKYKYKRRLLKYDE
jgi:hypothetical protein